METKEQLHERLNALALEIMETVKKLSYPDLSEEILDMAKACYNYIEAKAEE